jgi:putative sigma-54 modulation protein
MKITYTGKPEALTPPESRKIEAKFAKLARLLDLPGGEREAHVILAAERHLRSAEITILYHDHRLFGEGSAGDAFSAISTAIEKIEKQILKLRTKWRDTKRGPKQELVEEAPAAEPPASVRAARRAQVVQGAAGRETESGPRVLRANQHERNKPMTLEEALLEIDQRDYVVYRDAETDHVSVLIRRRDGNFDLIEA